MSKKQLLINWVFYSPAGHVVEALKHAYGYYVINKDKVDISLLLNGASAVELARGCPWLAEVYPVWLPDIIKHGDQADCLQMIPRTWDYIITDPRTKPEAFTPGWDEDELIAAHAVLQPLFHATEWSGDTLGWSGKWNDTRVIGQDTPLPYQLNAQLRLAVPCSAHTFVERYHHYGPKFCILPGGGAGLPQSPSLQVWERICRALTEHIPDLQLYFTGTSGRIDPRFTTEGFAPEQIDLLVDRLGNAANCYDIGMWNQIALVAACDVFCSPHTGFAFVAQLVGTPWLAISGCPWQEYLLNGIHFYSALPACDSYPAQDQTWSECGQRLANGQKAVCMEDQNIDSRIPDIINGAHLLMDPGFTYEHAGTLHLDKLKASDRNPKRFAYFDWST